MIINKKLGVVFLWHMHQPFYKDLVGDKYHMPWVRLHGIKDYYPMAALVDRFGGFKATFNLVPSLVEQINDYAENHATDEFLDLSVKKASELTPEEKVGILKNFFKVNFQRFIEPNARYSQLLIKKGLKPLSGVSLKNVLKSFTSQDFLDLQVLFNISWLHSINIDEDINLKGIVSKNESYTEEDKNYILVKQKEILRRILPLYKKLQDEARIEITTTPYYHPILPLLCDTSIAKRSIPDVKLPRIKFTHPEDAEWQIEAAIKYHTEQFGRPPRGMWPSEGSVSNKALEIMIAKGIDWVATDEDILFKSLYMNDKKHVEGINPIPRSSIYHPYKFKVDSRHIAMVFRDKNLSDIISFNYNSWDQADAAWDLIGHCKNIAASLKDTPGRALLTIVMDGENAWEYFEDNGRKFFETLYSNLDLEEDVGSTTVSEFLDIVHPKKVLSDIFPASWINHNFDIWIGQEQDNLSWEYLYKVRKDLVRFTKEIQNKPKTDGEKVRAAWREFYIAEGSDWNWWYGGRARRGADNPFDRLYLAHLKNIYKLLKKPIPDFLKISIA